MPARRVSTLIIAVALIAFAACSESGNGKDAANTSTPASMSTIPGPVMPVARSEAAGAFWDGKIAVAGGFTSPGQAVDRLALFDVGSGAWAARPPPPPPDGHF